MPEIASRLHGVCDSRYLDQISAATRAPRNVYLKDFSQQAMDEINDDAMDFGKELLIRMEPVAQGYGKRDGKLTVMH